MQMRDSENGSFNAFENFADMTRFEINQITSLIRIFRARKIYFRISSKYISTRFVSRIRVTSRREAGESSPRGSGGIEVVARR